MPVDIDKLAEGWLELESDPGLFTLLLEDFGVREVEVREVYDVSEQFWNEGLGDTRVFGFIFLFRWNPGRNRSRRKHLRSLTSLPVEYVEDKDVVNSIFFARQMVQNSCATHALLSVVLNCPDIDLGRTLDRLKDHTSGMDPENKGWAIANTPRLARDHNAHASPQAQRSPPPVTLSVTQQNPQGQQQVVKSRLALASSCTTSVTSETFHFVSYVPINGRLFELDGLKPFPVDHGPIGNDWTANFRKIIMNRLGIESKSGKFVTQDDEIHFSLMAVIPHQGASLVRKKARLQHWKTTFDSALNGLHLSEITETEAEEEKDRIAVLKAVMEEFHSSEQEQSLFSRSKTSLPNKPESSPALDCSWKVLQDFLKRGYEELLEEVKKLETGIKEEAEKQNKYRIDDARRVHNYDNFVTSFLTMLAEEGKLEPLIREQFAGRTDLVANSGLNSSDSKEAQVVAVKSVKRVMASRKAGQRKKKGRGRPKKAAYRK